MIDIDAHNHHDVQLDPAGSPAPAIHQTGEGFYPAMVGVLLDIAYTADEIGRVEAATISASSLSPGAPSAEVSTPLICAVYLNRQRVRTIFRRHAPTERDYLIGRHA